MPNLTIVAVISVAPNAVETIKPKFASLISETLKENGCLKYVLHQDNSDPTRYLFYETWENRELWQAHMKSPHVADFGAATENQILDVELFEMSIM